MNTNDLSQKYNTISGQDKWTVGDGIVTFYINAFPVHDIFYYGNPPSNEKLNYIYEKIKA